MASFRPIPIEADVAYYLEGCNYLALDTFPRYRSDDYGYSKSGNWQDIDHQRFVHSLEGAPESLLKRGAKNSTYMETTLKLHQSTNEVVRHLDAYQNTLSNIYGDVAMLVHNAHTLKNRLEQTISDTRTDIQKLYDINSENKKIATWLIEQHERGAKKIQRGMDMLWEGREGNLTEEVDEDILTTRPINSWRGEVASCVHAAMEDEEEQNNRAAEIAAAARPDTTWLDDLAEQVRDAPAETKPPRSQSMEELKDYQSLSYVSSPLHISTRDYVSPPPNPPSRSPTHTAMNAPSHHDKSPRSATSIAEEEVRREAARLLRQAARSSAAAQEALEALRKSRRTSQRVSPSAHTPPPVQKKRLSRKPIPIFTVPSTSHAGQASRRPSKAPTNATIYDNDPSTHVHHPRAATPPKWSPRTWVLDSRPNQWYKGRVCQKQDDQCDHCKKRGHWKVHCPDYHCKHCRLTYPGHIQSRCPQRPGYKCANCGTASPDHWTESCPLLDISEDGMQWDGADYDPSVESA